MFVVKETWYWCVFCSVRDLVQVFFNVTTQSGRWGEMCGGALAMQIHMCLAFGFAVVCKAIRLKAGSRWSTLKPFSLCHDGRFVFVVGTHVCGSPRCCFWRFSCLLQVARGLYRRSTWCVYTDVYNRRAIYFLE